MNRVILFNTPNINWVDKNNSCINLYLLDDITIYPNEVKMIYFNGFRIKYDDETIGVPFIPTKNEPFKLYHPLGSFISSGNKELSIAMINTSDNIINLTKGSSICKLKLMSIQYYSLMRKHNNSDKGLRSSYINIELNNVK